jgi:DNA adenine methylase
LIGRGDASFATRSHNRERTLEVARRQALPGVPDCRPDAYPSALRGAVRRCLAVLLSKPYEGISEVVNDLNGDLTNFWRVLQDKRSFAEFERRMAAAPFSETEWQDARDLLGQTLNGSSIDRAVSFFILCRQSMAGRLKQFAPITKNRTRRGMNEQASAWWQSIELLPAVHARLRRVVILSRPALDVIRLHDAPHTLFYLDPTYLPDTRTAKAAYGAFEMTLEPHRELLDTVRRLQGKVMLSGYFSQMYDDALAGWQRHEFDLPNNAAGSGIKRRMTECLWCNFETAGQQGKEAS